MEVKHTIIENAGVDRDGIRDTLAYLDDAQEIFESMPPDDLQGSQDAGGAARKPNFAIGTATDAANQFVIGNGR